ncbi:MAG TPA: DUF3320 domain-containing protein, partial [bacterium]|nr:DUF3320 domain-containing protein [bacterium]
PPVRSVQRAVERRRRFETGDGGLDHDHAASRHGVRPLPLRTSAYVAEVDELAPPERAHAVDEQEVAAEPPAPEPPAPQPDPRNHGPRDRLEHWRQRLLDLSMFNRLLNFVETRKTVPLCRHDLAAIEDRLQELARLRVAARPELAADDPRDLELAAQRTGSDVMADYLAAELRAGRLRSQLDEEQLGARLTEIFRHARTSIEETGANTLYLALGFLRWFESESSAKPRRAPLLLVPIVIERLSVQEGYRFVMDDAEVRANTTLLQLLERDFDLDAPFGDTLPEDDRGVDVGAVLKAFRRLVLAMPRWEVEDAACIGFFSFTKYLMWRDLENRDELLRSAVLRHLVDTPGAALQQDVPEYARDELDVLDPAEVFCPRDADSSQLAAVMAGAAGRSFVLEGPPGTGKSQTITNLIAQSLANGRRVLFVAEKRAALEVVYRRLAEVGLGPFCLELHSRKSGPKAVLEQLRATLALARRRAPAEWRQVAADLQAERTALNEFVDALHRRREFGWSVYQAMAKLLDLREAPRLPLPELLAGTSEDVQRARRALDDFAVASARLGVPADSPWWGVERGEWTPAVTRDALAKAERLRSAVARFAGALAPVVDVLALREVFGPRGASLLQVRTLLELLRAMRAAEPIPAEWFTIVDWRAFEADLERAIAVGRRRDGLWRELAPRWRRDLLELDLGTLAASYRLHAESFALLRWWRLRRTRPVLVAVAAAALPPPIVIRDDLDRALRMRDEERALATCSLAAAALGLDLTAGGCDWDALERRLHQVRELRRLVLALAPGDLEPSPQVLAAVAANLGERSRVRAAELFDAHDELVAARTHAQQLLDLSLVDAFGADDEPGYADRVADRVAGWLANAPGLRDQCAWRRAAEGAERALVGTLVAALAHGELSVRDLLPSFERSLYEGWLDHVHAREPQLAHFRGSDHEAAIARFAELDRRAIELGAEVVVARLAAKLPQLRGTNVGSSELGVLERELKKRRRHKPVRRLLHEIRGLWPRLSPCALMSPLSVAQFLDREAARFDLVVFDEASQIPMWDAVGAIGRGDALIVVGDSRQLPPTTFFQRMSQGDDLDEDLPEDLESVLDECGAAGLPRMQLDWHYRSRHESLIAFSNHHYYRNQLLTFPSPQQRAPGFGVRCVRVDGVYDRSGSQQNRIEAEALVADVVRRLRDPAQLQRSIGIVTFSRAQQTLIEDLLDAERRRDPAIDAALTQADEELFIKNLENVQGDERDVILFSICYGPDAAGKVYEHYGPLNLQGGERRLNVAVTRARCELVVFTSLAPEQVANRSAATGARHLRDFLDYAVRGEVALHAAVEHDPSRDVDSPFEAQVRDALVLRGHEVHTQVGCSGYRIDLAVVDPETPGRYLLGIECDGATYHRAATARDRDRLRAAVLLGLGWRLARVWSTDWWQDPDGEVERLEQAIADATDEVRDAEPVVLESPAGTADAEPVAPEDPDGPRDYELADVVAHPDDGDTVAHALRAEAPVVFDRLARRVADAWRIGRVTAKVRERVRRALPAAAVEDDGVCWCDAEQRATFRGFRVPVEERAERDVDELPAVEIDHAMAWLLRQHRALAQEDLLRETARVFGIHRLGSRVREVMTDALQRVLASERGRADGEFVRCVEDESV